MEGKWEVMIGKGPSFENAKKESLNAFKNMEKIVDHGIVPINAEATQVLVKDLTEAYRAIKEMAEALDEVCHDAEQEQCWADHAAIVAKAKGTA